MDDQAKLDELQKIGDQLSELTDITLEDDEDGNPRQLSSDQLTELRTLLRQHRAVMKDLDGN